MKGTRKTSLYSGPSESPEIQTPGTEELSASLRAYLEELVGRTMKGNSAAYLLTLEQAKEEAAKGNSGRFGAGRKIAA